MKLDLAALEESNMLKKSIITVAFIGSMTLSNIANAANVTCSFLSETVISKSGEWIKSEVDTLKMFEMFGDGLKLELQNSLLGKLDTQKPFFAGTVNRGSVYLMGSDMGVEGKLTKVTGDQIFIYDGMCQIGFG